MAEHPAGTGARPAPPQPPSSPQTPSIHRLGEVTSTQDEAGRRLDEGERAPFVVTARRQRAGRGRLGRRFVSPDGGNVYLSYAHSTALELSRRTWLPLVAGLAAVSALDAVAGSGGVRIGLKWPNDLQTADGRKLGGILVEGRGAQGVLIGIGINLRGPVRDGDGTEVPGAAWLLGAEGIRSDAAAPALDEDGRAGGGEALGDRIVSEISRSLARELAALESTDGDAATAGIAHRYTMTCLTLGQLVRVDPLGEDGADARPPALVGTAMAVDSRGRLMVDPVEPLEGGQVAVDVGDVRHVRPGGSARPTRGADRGVEQEEHGT